MEFGFEVIEAEIGPRWEPFILNFAPEDFDEVEFGAVGRQPVQADALSKPVQDADLKGVAGMDGSVIKNDQAELPGLGGLRGEGVQGGDDRGGGHGAGDGLKMALIRGTHKSQDIHARTGDAGKGQGLATLLPGIGNGRGKTETALVEIKQLDHPLDMTLSECRQARVRRAKGGFVARAFNPSPAPFPTIGFFLTIRCIVCRLACLPVACASCACACLSWRGSASSQSHNHAASSGV